jgi:UDPglucose 6-dehydrogenase
MQIGIVGLGVVGNVTYNILQSKHSMRILDPDKGFNNNISNCDIIFICINEKDPTMKNLDNLIAVLVKTNMRAIFVIRTTVIPGTTDRYIKTYNRDFVYMPEFIREWNVKYDTLHPDKIVIGTENQEIWGQLYGMFSYHFPNTIIIQVKPIEAEIAKLALNSLALIKVVYAEQLYDVVEKYKCDYGNIYRIFNSDQNINARHLFAGKDGYRGADGKCLPKDAEFLLNSSGASNMGLLKLAIELNKHYLKEGNNDERKSI